jgi:hypothetical protein
VNLARRAIALGLALAGLMPASLAGADSFTPVRLGIAVTPVARRHVKLPITVQVSADPGAFDPATGTLRLQVKLASECGGTYQYTPGTVLVDKPLSPQPAKGEPYSATVKGSGKPPAFGEQTVCVFLNEEADNRTFASDQSTLVNVSRRCTSRAARYDRARRALRRLKRHKHTRQRLKRTKHKVRRTRKAARRACGPAVKL